MVKLTNFYVGELEGLFLRNIKELESAIGHFDICSAEYEISLLLATKLVLLMIMKLKNQALTNEQLLLSQVQYNQKQLNMCRTIQAILKNVFKTAEELQTVIDTTSVFLDFTRTTLFLLCDEAQELLHIADGKFASHKEVYQSLYQKLVSEIVSYGNCIVAGTSLDIIYFEQVVGSNIAKPNSETKCREKHANFRHITKKEDCCALVERLFDVKLSDTHIQHILNKLQGTH